MTADVARSHGPWLDLTGEARVSAASRHASVRETERGLLAVVLDGAPPFTLATPLSNATQRCVATLRFERSGGGRTERMHVLPDRAAALLEWSGPAEGVIDVGVHFTGRVDVLSLDATRLCLRSSPGGGVVIATDGPVEWHVAAGDGAFTLRAAAPWPLRLVVGAADEDGRPARAVAPVLADPILGARIVAATVSRARNDGVEVSDAAGGIAAAFEWARSGLATANPRQPAADLAWLTCGRLIAGDMDGARSALESAVVDTASAAEQSAFVLAHARHLAWTGGAGPLSERRDDVVRALEHLAADDPDERAAAPDDTPSRLALDVAAVREGAVLAEALSGQADLAARLAGRARRARPAFGRWLERCREVDDEEAGLAVALGATDTLLPGAPVGTAGRIARAWGALEAGRVREGAEALGTASSALLGEAGRGSLPPRSAALFLCAVALGLVGTSPDATRDRMVLRPRLAADLLPFSARRIRAADALFDLTVTMDAERWVALIEQSAGGVPLQVVLQAWLASPAYREIRVDGRIADLDAVPLDGGWVLPVQLVPDRPRRVEVVLETSAGPS